MEPMPRKLPIHLYREINRHKKAVWYFRVDKGPRIRMPGEFGSAEFTAAYDAALNGTAVQRRAKGPEAGTFAWGAQLYMKSQAWATLAPTTREVRGNILRAIENKLGASKLASWKRGDVIAGRDARADRPAAARHFIDTLRGFFRFLIEAEHAATDPTHNVKASRPKTEGHKRWTDEEVAQFRRRWPLGTRERVAFEILRETGLRRGDAVRVGRPHLRDGVIRINTEKTGARVSIAVTDMLDAALAAGPVGEMTFIYAKTPNRPMGKEAFGNWFRNAASAAGVHGKSCHGLRKALATSDAQSGFSDAELDAKFGWTGRQMASLYTREANRERLSLEAQERAKLRTNSPAPTQEGAGKTPKTSKKSTAKN